MAAKSDWIESLMQMLGGRELLPENLSAAQMLKHSHFPSSLYKFRGVSDKSLMNLSASTVYLSVASSFNDPYDSAFNYDPLFGKSYAESLLDSMNIPALQRDTILKSADPIKAIIEYTALSLGGVFSEEELDQMTRLMKDGHSDFSSSIKSSMSARLQKSYKICSLTERLDSLPLWAHYAADHSGFAMEYDFKALPFLSILSLSLWPVNYSGIFDATEMLRGLEAGRPFNNFFGLMAALHKSPDWSYEHEWRLVLPDGPENPPQNYRAPLKAVYLGAKITPSDEAKVRDSAQIANIPIYRMRLVPHEFRMEAVAAG